MLPRALVLTADTTTSRCLQQALAGLRCELRPCKEIFSAIEQVTRESFDLLLIDWQDQLEANFLLNTARELKSNRATFALAVVAPTQAQEALQNGADAVLEKPFTGKQVQEIVLPHLRKKSESSELLQQPEGPNQQPRTQAQSPTPCLVKPRTAGPPASVLSELVKQQPVAPPRCELPEFEYKTRSKPSRMLSIAAIVWPLVITAALLSFDQWPRVPKHGRARLSGAIAAVRARAGAWLQRQASSTVQARDTGAAVSAEPYFVPTGDLLSDYTSPVPETAIPSGSQSWDDIDLASAELLPPSTRLIVPIMRVERPRPEIPNSLRFPPPTQDAKAVSPQGNLVAPQWVQSPIPLPETVSRSLLERQVAPKYPEEALRAGVNGSVVLQASIGRDGSVRDVKLVSGYLVLARAALDAVKQWRYRPYRHNGENVEVQTLITVDFKRPPRG